MRFIIRELDRDRILFRELLQGTARKEYTWKPRPESWCVLEVLCHLHDEEREDFRARVKFALQRPDGPLPSIDPQGWVSQRDYLGQDFDAMLEKFLHEREQSTAWLRSLKDPAWENAFSHPVLGEMTASKLLANWLAHDLLHIRQITRLRYDYLADRSGEDLGYAGTWK